MQEIEGGAATVIEGLIHISEDVLIELTRKTIQGIPNIQLAGTRFAAKFGRGRKGGDGIRVSVQNPDPKGLKAHENDKSENFWENDEDDVTRERVPLITIDAYVLVKYGKRIPDLAWDVQEKVKNNLERYTGYTVKAVNINVQGIYTDEPIQLELEQHSEAIAPELSGSDSAVVSPPEIPEATEMG